jgi:hypothetical protein
LLPKERNKERKKEKKALIKEMDIYRCLKLQNINKTELLQMEKNRHIYGKIKKEDTNFQRAKCAEKQKNMYK